MIGCHITTTERGTAVQEDTHLLTLITAADFLTTLNTNMLILTQQQFLNYEQNSAGKCLVIIQYIKFFVKPSQRKKLLRNFQDDKMCTDEIIQSHINHKNCK